MSKLDQAREDINRIDAEMARLFAQRMEAVQLVAEHKLEHGLPIRDAAREAALIERNCRYIEDDAIRESYAQFIRNTIDLSCDYQRRMMHPSGTLSVNLGARISVLTGVSLSEGKTGVMGYDKKNDEFYVYQNDRVGAMFHGTGDLFSSTVIGEIMHGKDWKDAMRIAADYTAHTIKVTMDDPKKPWYGVNFEETIPDLLAME